MESLSVSAMESLRVSMEDESFKEKICEKIHLMNKETVAYERFEELRDLMLKVLNKIEELEKKLEQKVEQLGTACANGFYQTRDAATCLREELSSCAGTIIDSTYVV
jgi:hypothetical protein